MIRQLIDRLSTAFTQPNYRKEIAGLQEAYRLLRSDLAALDAKSEEHAEKTRLTLERYRARSQPRKDGRFSSEDPAEPTNSRRVMDQPTHEEIEQMVRSQGSIR